MNEKGSFNRFVLPRLQADLSPAGEEDKFVTFLHTFVRRVFYISQNFNVTASKISNSEIITTREAKIPTHATFAIIDSEDKLILLTSAIKITGKRLVLDSLHALITYGCQYPVVLVDSQNRVYLGDRNDDLEA